MKRGLTLIEVVLAVAILSVGMVVLLTSASRCLAVIRAAKMYEAALWTLGQGDAEFPLRVTDEAEDLAVEETEYENGCTYAREVDEDEDEDNLYVVRTRVSWDNQDRVNTEVVVRYVYLKEK